MMDKKLPEKELLEELANMSLCRNISLMTRGKQKEAMKSAQAYTQLKEIVGNWFLFKNTWDSMKKEQQKPTVTKEWVKEVGYILRHIAEWEQEQYFIQILEMLGVEIE